MDRIRQLTNAVSCAKFYKYNFCRKAFCNRFFILFSLQLLSSCLRVHFIRLCFFCCFSRQDSFPLPLICRKFIIPFFFFNNLNYVNRCIISCLIIVSVYRCGEVGSNEQQHHEYCCNFFEMFHTNLLLSK